MTPLPLNHFRVIDLTAHRAGPTAVRQLADWGAQVIKIEPSGELVDATGSRRDGPDFQNLHRNKRAMTLNLKSDEGRAIFFKLAERADVIVENYKSDVKHRLGIDYEAVRKINPRIVYGSIDDARIDLAHRFVVDAEPVFHIGFVVLDDDVGAFGELHEDRVA